MNYYESRSSSLGLGLGLLRTDVAALRRCLDRVSGRFQDGTSLVSQATQGAAGRGHAALVVDSGVVRAAADYAFG